MSQPKETIYLFTAALTVTALAWNLDSLQESRADDTDPSFSGERRPGIIEEATEGPTGPNADLYLEIEKEFEFHRASLELQEE